MGQKFSHTRKGVYRKQAYPLEFVGKPRGSNALGKNAIVINVGGKSSKDAELLRIKRAVIVYARRHPEGLSSNFISEVSKAKSTNELSDMFSNEDNETLWALMTANSNSGGGKVGKAGKAFRVQWVDKKGDKVHTREFRRKVRAERFAYEKLQKNRSSVPIIDERLGSKGSRWKMIMQHDEIEKLWFNPKKHRGWNKNQGFVTRRDHLLASTDHRHSMHNRYLEAGRAAGALANVTTDNETRLKAQQDARYFLEKAKGHTL